MLCFIFRLATDDRLAMCRDIGNNYGRLIWLLAKTERYGMPCAKKFAHLFTIAVLGWSELDDCEKLARTRAGRDGEPSISIVECREQASKSTMKQTAVAKTRMRPNEKEIGYARASRQTG
jgi:hypothetical protein